MAEFFKQRSTQYTNRMLRYMKYVFNDHFILVCLFLMGGAGFYYSDLVKTLPKGFFWGKLIVMFILLFALSVGKVATLLQEADLVFLLPKEIEMKTYLRKATLRSLILPFLFLTLITGFLMPLLVVSMNGKFSDFLFFWVVMLVSKIIWLDIEKEGYYQGKQTRAMQMKIALLITTAILLYLMMFGSVYAFPLVFGNVSFAYLVAGKTTTTSLFDWERAIHEEKKRIHRVYKFISLFTDVPEITSVVKRRKYFDLLLKPIQTKHKNTYFYLYLRAFLRGSEYLGLVIRLSVIGGVVLVFTEQEILSMAIGVLFLYLIAFQLLPLYLQFDYMTLTHLYPVKVKDKESSFLGLMILVMCVVCIVFGLCVWTSNFLIYGVFLATALLLALPYTMMRIKKLEKRK